MRPTFWPCEQQVDLATNNNMELTRFQKLYRIEPTNQEYPEISSIPNDPLVWRTDLPNELKAKIKTFILGYGRQGPDAERQRQVLAHLGEGWLPFQESNNAQLLPIRQLSLAKEKMTIENSQDMPVQDKQSKLAAIDAKLADLQRQVENQKQAEHSSK